MIDNTAGGDAVARTTVPPVQQLPAAWVLPGQRYRGAMDQLPDRSSGTESDGASSDSPAQLRFYPDGPLLVRGDFEMIGRDGNPLPRTRATVALCRCGRSSIKPYCDGSHKLSRFSDVPPADAEAATSSEPKSG